MISDYAKKKYNQRRALRREANPELYKERNKAYYNANKDRLLAKMKEYREIKQKNNGK